MPSNRKINLPVFDFRIGKHFLDEFSERTCPVLLLQNGSRNFFNRKLGDLKSLFSVYQFDDLDINEL